MGKYEEVLEEGGGQGPRVQRSTSPRVPRSRGPKVPGSQRPRYLKVTFKFELDSKEGPSCCRLINKQDYKIWSGILESKQTLMI